jgi:hypothetical protein
VRIVFECATIVKCCVHGSILYCLLVYFVVLTLMSCSGFYTDILAPSTAWTCAQATSGFATVCCATWSCPGWLGEIVTGEQQGVEAAAGDTVVVGAPTQVIGTNLFGNLFDEYLFRKTY